MKINYLLAVAILLVSCQATESEVYDPTDTIAGFWAKFVENWESENADGCVSFYHENIVYIGPEANVVNNRNEVRDFYAMLFDNHQSSTYHYENRSLSFCDGLAVEYSFFSVDWITHEGSSWTYSARMVAEWKADDEGNWQITTLIFNQPQSVTLPEPEVESNEIQ